MLEGSGGWHVAVARCIARGDSFGFLVKLTEAIGQPQSLLIYRDSIQSRRMLRPWSATTPQWLLSGSPAPVRWIKPSSHVDRLDHR